MAEPDCALAAAHNLPHGSEMQLLAAEEDGRFFAATPVWPWPGRGPLRLPIVTTDIRRMTWLGTPLLSGERSAEALRVLLSSAKAKSAPRSLCFFVKWLNEGPTATALYRELDRLHLPYTPTADFDQPFLLRRADPAAYTANQSKRHMSEYRRRARRLSETLGHDLSVVNVAGDDAGIEEYIRLEAAGYKRELGVAMTTRIGETDYFRELCGRFAASGRLHHLALRAGNRTIAMQTSLEAGEGLFLVKVSHDEEFARFDPGVQLHLRAMEYFHFETSAKWINVCTFPDNELLLRLYLDRRRIQSLVIGHDSYLGRALVRSLPAALPLARRASRSLVHLHHAKGAA